MCHALLLLPLSLDVLSFLSLRHFSDATSSSSSSDSEPVICLLPTDIEPPLIQTKEDTDAHPEFHCKEFPVNKLKKVDSVTDSTEEDPGAEIPNDTIENNEPSEEEAKKEKLATLKVGCKLEHGAAARVLKLLIQN